MTAITTLEWIHQHDLFWAAISAIVAAVLVARRRALDQIAASRSWTAALPVERSTEEWQGIVVSFAPALVLACVVAAMFGGVSLIAIFGADISAPISTWAATTGGVSLGAGLGYLLPSGRPKEIYESSRYVPRRRRTETPIPTGSISALGSWPVRQMFGSARPKTIARALIPVLLSLPLGSTAADAMLAIALLAVIGALVLLVAATVSVSANACHWLKPSPIRSGLVAGRALLPALPLMFCATAIESWLIWVLGSPVPRCVEIGVLTLAASWIITVAGSFFAVYAMNRGGNDRL